MNTGLTDFLFQLSNNYYGVYCICSRFSIGMFPEMGYPKSPIYRWVFNEMNQPFFLGGRSSIHGNPHMNLYTFILQILHMFLHMFQIHSVNVFYALLLSGCSGTTFQQFVTQLLKMTIGMVSFASTSIICSIVVVNVYQMVDSHQIP